jgi:hypothetical protein
MGRWSSTEDGVIQRLVAARTAGGGGSLQWQLIAGV